MGLDIRLPIGLMFSTLGPILLVTGLVQHTEVNVMTGIAMGTFGGLMLAFGLRAQRRGGS